MLIVGSDGELHALTVSTSTMLFSVGVSIFGVSILSIVMSDESEREDKKECGWGEEVMQDKGYYHGGV